MKEWGVALILLITVFAISYNSLNVQCPLVNKYYYITLKGKVYPSTNFSSSNKPAVVRVYYPPVNSNSLCTGDEIKETFIEWINDTKGAYSITFGIPVEMDVYLTTDFCTGYEKTTILKSDTIKNVDVMYSYPKVDDDVHLSDNSEEIVNGNRRELSEIETGLSDRYYANSSKKDEIREDIRQARDKISELNDVKNDANESLVTAYLSEWYTIRATNRIQLLDLEQCIEEQTNLLKKFTPQCYEPDPNSYIDFQSANNSYISHSVDDSFKKYNYEVRDIKDLRRDILSLYDLKGRIADGRRKCQNSIEINNKTFEFQRDYCEGREFSLIALKTSGYALAVIIGIIIGLFMKKVWYKLKIKKLGIELEKLK